MQDAGNEATAARVTSKGLLLCPLVGLSGPQMRLGWYARDVMEYSSVVGLDTRLASVPPLLRDLHPRLLALFLSAIDRYQALATLWSIRTRWTRIPSKIGLVSTGTISFSISRRRRGRFHSTNCTCEHDDSVLSMSVSNERLRVSVHKIRNPVSTSFLLDQNDSKHDDTSDTECRDLLCSRGKSRSCACYASEGCSSA